MPTIEERMNHTLESLRAAITAPAALPQAIAALQELVWNGTDWDAGLSEAASETLRDLAYDLDFYVADPSTRAQGPVVLRRGACHRSDHECPRESRELAERWRTTGCSGQLFEPPLNRSVGETGR
jgi:hypothetical protein